MRPYRNNAAALARRAAEERGRRKACYFFGGSFIGGSGCALRHSRAISFVTEPTPRQSSQAGSGGASERHSQHGMRVGLVCTNSSMSGVFFFGMAIR